MPPKKAKSQPAVSDQVTNANRMGYAPEVYREMSADWATAGPPRPGLERGEGRGMGYGTPERFTALLKNGKATKR